MERALTDFARQPNGGVIVTLSGASTKHRDLIITLTNQHRLPAVYAQRYFIAGGGLIAYGPDTVEQYRQAARSSHSQRMTKPDVEMLFRQQFRHDLRAGRFVMEFAQFCARCA